MEYTCEICGQEWKIEHWAEMCCRTQKRINRMVKNLEQAKAERDNLKRVNSELLAALKGVVEIFEMDDEANNPGTDAYARIVVANEAIKLAEEGGK